MTSGPAAVSSQGGKRIDVFYRGPNNHLWTARWPDKPGSPWWSGAEDLNAEMTSGPAAVVAEDGKRIDVFYRGPNNHLWTVRWPDKPGSPWWSGAEDLNAEMTSGPAAVVTQDGKRIDVFYRGPNNRLWTVRWPDKPGGQWWSGAEDLNAEMTSGPAAVASAGGKRIDVFYRGPNNHLWTAYWPDNPGGMWWSSGKDLNIEIASEPAAIRNDDVFYQGSNNHLWRLGPAPPPPTIDFAAFDAPGAVWGGTNLKVSWSFAIGGSCSPEGRIRMTEGGNVLADAALQFPNGSTTIQPATIGKVHIAAWASCAGVTGSTVLRTKIVEVNTAYPGPTCPGGQAPQYYTFCLSASDQTSPPECYRQTETSVLSCSKESAEREAQRAAVNWKMAEGTCPRNCR